MAITSEICATSKRALRAQYFFPFAVAVHDRLVEEARERISSASVRPADGIARSSATITVPRLEDWRPVPLVCAIRARHKHGAALNWQAASRLSRFPFSEEFVLG